MLQRLSRRRIARLGADIDLLDKRLVEIVGSDTALAHRYRLLSSMPGVGPVVSLGFAAIVDRIDRFRNAHQLESQPATTTSGWISGLD